MRYMGLLRRAAVRAVKVAPTSELVGAVDGASPSPGHRLCTALSCVREQSCSVSVTKPVVIDAIVAARAVGKYSWRGVWMGCTAPTPAARPCTGGASRMKGTEQCGYVIRYGVLPERKSLLQQREQAGTRLEFVY